MLELMGRVTSMRGAQSYGFAASTKTKVKVHKEVVPKRGDIARMLSRNFNVKGLPLAVAAHLRFATSSKTTKRDAHPHVWGKGRTSVLTWTAQRFVAKDVSRAVIVTHNGDFEAFDWGACFASDSKVVDLDVLREWLAQRLGVAPPSSGDSIVAAGMLELLFAAGDPFASARLALVDYEPSIVEAAAAVLKRVLLEARDVTELSWNGASEASRERHMKRVQGAVADGLKNNAEVAAVLAARGRLQDAAGKVASAAVRNFFEADLRSAVRRFLKHATGSFGLVVTSSLAPCALVLASVKQPMNLGVGDGFAVYASERAALHAGVIGTKLRKRSLLKDGDVVWMAPGANDVRIAKASLYDDAPFCDLVLDVVQGNPLVMSPVAGVSGDVVGDDIADTPRVLRRVRDSFRDPASFNSATAHNLARHLLLHQGERAVDLVVVGVEASLWVAEQWAANMRAVFPKLRIVVASANKVLASLTAVANDATCGAQTPGYTVFPSGTTPTAAVRDAVALVVSHSGQTFPCLNASRALKNAGAIVFAVAGLQDTVIASDVLEQSFALGAEHSSRLFSTDAGIRLAEAASLTTAATHVVLTEIMYALAVAARARLGEDTDQCVLVASDLRDLRVLQDATIDDNVPMLCNDCQEGPRDEAKRLGRNWGLHVVEPFVAFLAATAYVLATVIAKKPLFFAVPGPPVLDAFLYAFFPVVAALVLRLIQGRTLLARFGKRTVLVLDVPQVHQCVTAFAQKLFGLSYGLNSVEIAGFNPSDHAVHRCLHRVVRGTLVALGVPDGRLRALVDSECAAFLTASQIKSIEHWGVGPELVTVGHHTYAPDVVDGAVIFDKFNRPAFLSEIAHDGVSEPATTPSASARRVAFLSKPSSRTLPTRGVLGGASLGTKSLKDVLTSHTVVETLYEGRIAALERQLAFYVFFHTVATTASRALYPFFHFDTWRSQAGTRVATTPAPTSPANEEQALPKKIDRVTTHTDFETALALHHQHHYFFHPLDQSHRATYDALTDDGDVGMDLSAHDGGGFQRDIDIIIDTP